MIAKARKALLLRVGMDRGTGGALGPIFRDATFEYVPIPEQQSTLDRRTYATLPGRHGRPLGDYLPRRLTKLHPHVDPDFKTFTYGDAAPRKRRQLAKLAPGDFLVFYCGLAPCPPNDAPRLYLIGNLCVKQVHCLTAGDVKRRRGLQHRFGKTAHFLRSPPDRELVLVEGDRTKSRLFRRALALGDRHDNLLRDLERFGYQGSIQRAVGHWVRGDNAMEFLDAWLKNGPTILVDHRTRLFVLPPSFLVLVVKRKRDIEVVVKKRCPEPGDWILILGDGQAARIMVFARINRCKEGGGRRRGFSSLCWHFTQVGAPVRNALPSFRSLRDIQNGTREYIIRKLVAWLGSHYRIGSL